MNRKLPLRSFKLKSFKAVQDSRKIQFTPLTAFIGNNGSGKSSIIEALETLQRIVLQDIDRAMAPWHGFEHVWNKAKDHSLRKDRVTNPMTFSLLGNHTIGKCKFQIEIAADESLNRIFFQKYKAAYGPGEFLERPNLTLNGEVKDPELTSFVEGWQFLRLNPYAMTEPLPQRRSSGSIRLESNGSNIAEYLWSIHKKDVQAFNGIIDAVKVVLPSLIDLQPAITSELDRRVYLNLSEDRIHGKMPGWLLSTGTLRILALLSIFHDPEPPSLIIIEEIENGLDPRTIHLLVEEMRYFIESGRGQIILTTHSSYLLDLLTLSQIIVVERDENGSPQFTRPSSSKEMAEWAKKFSPGRLYTMGKLNRS